MSNRSHRPYSYHREFYDRALKKIVATAGRKLEDFHDWYGLPEEGAEYSGWLEYFEKNHPDQYRKYQAAVDQITSLWGRKEPEAMEQWKAAVKIEVEATQWAVDRYIEHMKNLAEGKVQETLAV